MSDLNDNEDMFGSEEEDEEELSAPCQFCQEHAHGDPGEGKEICLFIASIVSNCLGISKSNAINSALIFVPIVDQLAPPRLLFESGM